MMLVMFIFLLLSVLLITVLYETDLFGKKNELDYFLASQKLLCMLPFVQLSICIIQLGGLCLGSSLVVLFNDNTAYAMERDLMNVKTGSDSDGNIPSMSKTAQSDDTLEKITCKSRSTHPSSWERVKIGPNPSACSSSNALPSFLINLNCKYESTNEFLTANNFNLDTCISNTGKYKISFGIPETFHAPLRPYVRLGLIEGPQPIPNLNTVYFINQLEPVNKVSTQLAECSIALCPQLPLELIDTDYNSLDDFLTKNGFDLKTRIHFSGDYEINIIFNGPHYESTDYTQDGYTRVPGQLHAWFLINKKNNIE